MVQVAGRYWKLWAWGYGIRGPIISNIAQATWTITALLSNWWKSLNSDTQYDINRETIFHTELCFAYILPIDFASALYISYMFQFDLFPTKIMLIVFDYSELKWL